MKTVPILYFSDILCVWAYIAQHRLDEAHTQFRAQIAVDLKFCSVFGDTARKMESQWAAKGGYEGFNAHLRHAVTAFPEVELNPNIWLTVKPASSTSPHLFLKAAQLAERQEMLEVGASARLTRGLRDAFFRQARNISDWATQVEVADEGGIDRQPIEALIRSGQAFAALASDYQDADTMGVKGSPSFVLNEGRQKLYGNVGYKIIEANIQELLRDPDPDHASWC